MSSEEEPSRDGSPEDWAVAWVAAATQRLLPLVQEALVAWAAVVSVEEASGAGLTVVAAEEVSVVEVAAVASVEVIGTLAVLEATAVVVIVTTVTDMLLPEPPQGLEATDVTEIVDLVGMTAAAHMTTDRTDAVMAAVDSVTVRDVAPVATWSPLALAMVVGIATENVIETAIAIIVTVTVTVTEIATGTLTDQGTMITAREDMTVVATKTLESCVAISFAPSGKTAWVVHVVILPHFTSLWYGRNHFLVRSIDQALSLLSSNPCIL